MKVSLNNIGKRYRREWIFRGIDFEFATGKKYAISGHNGSGKSTFLRVLSGHLTPSKGKIEHFAKEQKVGEDDIYKHLSYAAPYIDLIEELTLREALRFHQNFKPFTAGLNEKTVLDLLQLPKSEDKEVRNFSSGMKQRLKLALALCSDSSLVLLDEPTTNLDRQGVAWYLDLIEKFAAGKTLIIASNVKEDFDFCDERLLITDFKKKK